MPPSGVFAVYKPRGLRSANAVATIKKVLNSEFFPLGVRRNGGVKVGHGGTLDSGAEGLLVIGVGDGCKRMSEFLHGDKRYITIGKLGAATASYDSDTDITHTAPYDHVSEESLLQTLPLFCGNIMQVPPSYSALKVNGRRHSDLARANKLLEMPPQRPVTVSSLQLLHFQAPEFKLDISCGGGTYIRSLVHDMAKHMNSAAHVVYLQRTQVGPFRVDSPFTLHQHDWTVPKIEEALRHSETLISQ